MLDVDESGKLSKGQFGRVIDLLNMRIRARFHSSAMSSVLCPAVYESAPSKWLRRATVHPIFRYLFDLAIVANAITIAATNSNWIPELFLVLFNLELILKVRWLRCPNRDATGAPGPRPSLFPPSA
ncbi:MAG: hypothetical protein KIT86_23190 [Hydrogenophaga sp.]|uniref:hypothetical protein n=1 Tax=Hydrogenophaga sp. TaxID=1904254 RepID=UPI00261F2208|nr:hypothetical protein [Hydrogenophaga sp.]MCW5672573.1 hypothetical protein [Hydrogenophaga sp.]